MQKLLLQDAVCFINENGLEVRCAYNPQTGTIDSFEWNKRVEAGYIMMPYVDELFTYSTVLSAYSDILYETSGVRLDYPKRHVSAYLRDKGYYEDFLFFQDEFKKVHLAKWFEENSIPYE